MDKNKIIIGIAVVAFVLVFVFAVQKSSWGSHLSALLLNTDSSASPRANFAAKSGQPASQAAPAQNRVACPKQDQGQPTHAVLINEIAWAGIASKKTGTEWIELKNPGESQVSLAGYEFLSGSGADRKSVV